MSNVDLWVLSAGYGLISGRTHVSSYGATFSAGLPDTVWRGPADGDRLEVLRQWWEALPHEQGIAVRSRNESDHRVVLVAGATYVKAIQDELAALESMDGGDRFSIISAGSKPGGWVLPVRGAFRPIVGGARAALNARTLALLAGEAEHHAFSRSKMALLLRSLDSEVPALPRKNRQRLSDRDVVRWVCQVRQSANLA